MALRKPLPQLEWDYNTYMTDVEAHASPAARCIAWEHFEERLARVQLEEESPRLTLLATHIAKHKQRAETDKATAARGEFVLCCIIGTVLGVVIAIMMSWAPYWEK